MGLWKALDMQKVAMMKTHPRRDGTEHTRSITLIALSWSSLSFTMVVELLDKMAASKAQPVKFFCTWSSREMEKGYRQDVELAMVLR